jgi:hypothetical protein
MVPAGNRLHSNRTVRKVEVMNHNLTQTSRQTQLQKILAGVAKHFSNVTSLTMGGASYAVADIVKLVQQDLDAMAANANAKAAVRVAVQVERDTHAKANPVLRLLKAYVIAVFGGTQAATDTLADFGYAPRKPGKQKLQTKVVAKELATATREARHTIGPKKKAKIKGTLPATTPASSTPSKPNG